MSSSGTGKGKISEWKKQGWKLKGMKGDQLIPWALERGRTRAMLGLGISDKVQGSLDLFNLLDQLSLLEALVLILEPQLIN